MTFNLTYAGHQRNVSFIKLKKKTSKTKKKNEEEKRGTVKREERKGNDDVNKAVCVRIGERICGLIEHSFYATLFLVEKN
jgi:hypothetical protein